MKKRFTEEQIIGVLKEAEAGARVADLSRKYGIAEATFYNWKTKFGGMTVSQAQRLKELESENSKLKHLLADAMLDNAALKEWLVESGKPAGETTRRRAFNEYPCAGRDTGLRANRDFQILVPVCSEASGR